MALTPNYPPNYSGANWATPSTLTEAQSTPFIREPSIPERIQETQADLATAHAVLDRLEGGGPVPGGPADAWTFVGGTQAMSQSAAALVGRLRTLFGDTP